MAEADWALLLRFDTDHPEFVRGFEAARMYERARADATTWEQTIHVSNAEMALRIAEATGREVSAGDAGDPDWLVVRFE